MTHKGGTAQACAACKFQRRKCYPDCPLAPYFPPDQPKMFQNAHKLFGVKKIVKIIEKLDPARKQEAMRSIIYESNMRDRFPVHGCSGIICQLGCQIRQYEEELFALNAQLEMYRSQQNQNQISGLEPEDEASQLVLGMAPPTNDQQAVFSQFNAQQMYSNVNAGDFVDSSDCLWFGNQNMNQNLEMGNNFAKNDTNSMMIQPFPEQQLVEDYDEIHHSFSCSINDRQSYIDQEAYQSSSGESLKETTRCIEQHVADKELKNAAACFSLTSVN